MNPINLQTMLADYAVVADGKLTIIGGGWSIISPNPTPHAVAISVKVPWDRTNEKHRVTARLVDEDGTPFQPEGVLPEFAGLRQEYPVEVGRAAGVRPGTPMDHPIAVNVSALPLTPGKRYVWEIELDGDAREEWNLPFTVAELPPGQIRLAG